jgi:hypothetical protein
MQIKQGKTTSNRLQFALRIKFRNAMLAEPFEINAAKVSLREGYAQRLRRETPFRGIDLCLMRKTHVRLH